MLLLLVSSKYSSRVESFLTELTDVLHAIDVELHMLLDVSGIEGAVITNFTRFPAIFDLSEFVYLKIDIGHFLF